MTPHLYPVSSSSPPPAPPPPPPPRSGEPWVSEDYEAIVRACREQEKPTIATLAEAVGRTPAALGIRIKALLPLDQRGGPADLVPGRLRASLLADEAYDWQAHLSATPPPRPVVEHVHPPDVLTGINGLEDDELLAMAGSMAQLASTGFLDDGPALDCASEVVRRGLATRLASAAARAARDRVERFLADAEYGYGRYGRPPGGGLRVGADEEEPSDDEPYYAPPPPEGWY